MQIFRVLFFIFLFSFSFSSARAQNVYVLDQDFTIDNLTNYTQLTSSDTPYYLYELDNGTTLNIGASGDLSRDKYHWARIDLANLSDENVSFFISARAYNVHSTGFRWSFYASASIEKADIVSYDKSVPLKEDEAGIYFVELPARSINSLVMQVSSDGPLAVFLSPSKDDFFAPHQVFQSFLLGLLFLLLFSSLVLLFFVYDLSYLGLSISCLAGLVLIFLQSGISSSLPDIFYLILPYLSESLYSLGLAFVVYRVLANEAKIYNLEMNFLLYPSYFLLFAGLFASLGSFFTNDIIEIYSRFFSLSAPVLCFAVMVYGSIIGQRICQLCFLSFLLIFLHGFIRIFIGFVPLSISFGDLILNISLVVGLCSLFFTLLRLSFESLRNSILISPFGRKALALISSNISVWQWHIDSDIVNIDNHIALKMGLDKSSLLNCSHDDFIDYIHPLDRDGYLANIERVLSEGGTHFSLEFRLRGANGDYYWVELQGRGVSHGHSSIDQCIGVIKDVSEIHKLRRKWMFEAKYDVLTGYPNQKSFREELSKFLTKMLKNENGKKYIALIQIEPLRLNRVNSVLGHEIGDSLLSQISRILSGFVSEFDLKGRLSGDNFVLALRLSEDSYEDAKAELIVRIENICEKFLQPLISHPLPICLDTYMGVYITNQHLEAEEMIAKTDIALSSLHDSIVKQKYCFYTEPQAGYVLDNITLEMALRQAVDKDELRVFYQPIIRLSDYSIAGFEALLRWQHEEYGLMSPNDFLPIVERAGIGVEVGRFVIKNAIQTLGKLQQKFPSKQPLFMAINLSNSQIESIATKNHILEDINNFAQQAKVNTETLIMEISENISIDDFERYQQIFTTIKNTGVKIALDDFGDGNTSITYLQNLPIDILKISGSFLHNTHSGGKKAKSRNFLNQIISLLNKNGFTIIAEGVENEKDLKDVTKANCKYAQGFIFAGSMPIEQLFEFIQKYQEELEKNGKDFLQVINEKNSKTNKEQIST